MKSKANMLLDIVSPRLSEEASKLQKQRLKTKKIIETRHTIDHYSLIRAFSVNNPAKRIRENLINNNVVRSLMIDEFDGIKNWEIMSERN